MSSSHIHLPPKIKYSRKNGTNDVFLIHERIGKGSYGVVHRVTHQNTNKTYAMKILSKKKYNNAGGQIYIQQMKNEINIQKSLKHPNIVCYKLSFASKSYQYIVLEYCPGNTISDYLKSSPEKRLSDIETRQILKDVINGLIYLRSQKVIHHDIKPDNFIVGSDGRIKISDFGISSVLKSQNHKNCMTCGTTAYMGPEMFLEDGLLGHGFEVDVWALGVSTFQMLTGRLPFEGPDKKSTEEKIKNCDYKFPHSVPVSPEAKDFIEKILQIDPEKRPSLYDLINHPFLKKLDVKRIKFYSPQKVRSSPKK
ncbi:hypothetical protein M9Y10_018006 [Tritrichomonas musculus]|uniref:Protein kinase domain-containing protein n=1 Tax=Tritrichomonas musculus TaxID=1915356 RepID=A0ABR2HV27_9EUKA